jgi:hypothetical protein
MANICEVLKFQYSGDFKTPCKPKIVKKSPLNGGGGDFFTPPMVGTVRGAKRAAVSFGGEGLAVAANIVAHRIPGGLDCSKLCRHFSFNSKRKSKEEEFALTDTPLFR